MLSSDILALSPFILRAYPTTHLIWIISNLPRISIPILPRPYKTHANHHPGPGRTHKQSSKPNTNAPPPIQPGSSGSAAWLVSTRQTITYKSHVSQPTKHSMPSSMTRSGGKSSPLSIWPNSNPRSARSCGRYRPTTVRGDAGEEGAIPRSRSCCLGHVRGMHGRRAGNRWGRVAQCARMACSRLRGVRDRHGLLPYRHAPWSIIDWISEACRYPKILARRMYALGYVGCCSSDPGCLLPSQFTSVRLCSLYAGFCQTIHLLPSPAPLALNRENTQAPPALLDLFYVWTSARAFTGF